VLQGQVRIALGRQIIQDIAGPGTEVPVMSLDADLERLLQGALSNSGSTLEPGLAEKLQQKLAESTRRREVAGEPAVLLVPPTLRAPLASFVRSSVPGLHVLAWNEIPHNRKVRLVTTVGR
jgi:flagellar biosynthesis protein FlhA